MITYTLQFCDNEGTVGTVKFPAISQLMAIAWAELCFEANGWEAACLWAENEVVENWSKK